MHIGTTIHLMTAMMAGWLCATAAQAQTAPRMKMTTDIPADITTQKVYDNLDFQRLRPPLLEPRRGQ